METPDSSALDQHRDGSLPSERRRSGVQRSRMGTFLYPLSASTTSGNRCTRTPFGKIKLWWPLGAKFMAGFEQACQAKGIVKSVLSPRSPKIDGCVDRPSRILGMLRR